MDRALHGIRTHRTFHAPAHSWAACLPCARTYTCTYQNTTTCTACLSPGVHIHSCVHKPELSSTCPHGPLHLSCVHICRCTEQPPLCHVCTYLCPQNLFTSAFVHTPGHLSSLRAHVLIHPVPFPVCIYTCAHTQPASHSPVCAYSQVHTRGSPPPCAQPPDPSHMCVQLYTHTPASVPRVRTRAHRTGFSSPRAHRRALAPIPARRARRRAHAQPIPLRV